jgi:hypothetical protein
MHRVRARIQVDPNRTISGIAPQEVPPGEHDVTIVIAPVSGRRADGEPFDVNRLPTVDLGPWPEGVSLRREDLYGDDGR